jgi:predicted N-acetyltransferase YhbS
MEVTIRPAKEADGPECGRIIYEAFKGIAEQRRFPPDVPSVDFGVTLARSFIAHPAIFGVVAESDRRVIGSNFLDERDPIRGVGPITVDPAVQKRGAGRRLMQAVLERGKGAPGIRLLQDAFNTLSMPLYASLGFDVKEPIVFITGKLKGRPSRGITIRRMKRDDIGSCAELCRRVHGFERLRELEDVVEAHDPLVVLRDGRIRAYGLVSFFGHGVAETDSDMRELLLGVSASGDEPISFLLPTRQAALFRWCLSEGMQVVKPMTLMALGDYQEPTGSWFPSILY